MISTLDDLHSWAQAVATGALIGPELQRQRLIWNPRLLGQTHGRGLFGLGIYGARLGNLLWVGYDGGAWGFNADAWYLPSRRATIVVLANSYSPLPAFEPAADLAGQFMTIVSRLRPAR
jgi:D-alanyl-D-alanine carboxypeptidase